MMQAIKRKTEDFLEAILSLPNMIDDWPQISPDGRWVAWTWMRVGPAADVFVAPSDGSAAPLRLTNTSQETFFDAWLPDSSGVLVEQDRDGNERAQVFRIDLQQPLEMIPLTEANPEYYLRGARLHPNGRWLVYGANYDFESGKEIEPTWLYRHDLLSGERLALARPEKSSYMLPRLNLPGTHVLYTRQDLHPAGRQVWLADIEGQTDEEILNFGPQTKCFASWFPDGQRMVVLVETRTHRRLGIWHLQSRQIDWLLDNPGRDIEDAFVPANSQADQARIVVVENVRGRTQCSLLDPQSGSEKRLPEVQGNLIPLAPLGGEDWAGFYFSSRQPKDVVRFSLAKADAADFTSLSRLWQRTQLRPEDFTPAEDYAWRSVDGLEVHGWLYRPKGKAKGTIVYVHGGPTWHSQDWINYQIQFFAREGFNVLDPNYRGSTGYGLPFRLAILEQGWGSLEQEDIRSGIEALIAAGIAEPGKVGITGTSYGGYSSWFAITHFPVEIVAASAPVCGMTDLAVDYETTRPDLRPYSEEMMGGSPAQVPERYYERSPVNFVQQIGGKLLIVQGEQDPNVTPQNVNVVRAALEQAGIKYELLTFADEGHGIARPANQMVLCRRLLAFFEQAFGSDAS